MLGPFTVPQASSTTTGSENISTVNPADEVIETTIVDTPPTNNTRRRFKRVSKVDSRPAHVEFFRQNGITVAIIKYENGLLGIGVSKQAAGDKHDVRAGRRLATQRASPNPRFTRFVRRTG